MNENIHSGPKIVKVANKTRVSIRKYELINFVMSVGTLQQFLRIENYQCIK